MALGRTCALTHRACMQAYIPDVNGWTHLLNYIALRHEKKPTHSDAYICVCQSYMYLCVFVCSFLAADWPLYTSLATFLSVILCARPGFQPERGDSMINPHACALASVYAWPLPILHAWLDRIPISVSRACASVFPRLRARFLPLNELPNDSELALN